MQKKTFCHGPSLALKSPKTAPPKYLKNFWVYFHYFISLVNFYRFVEKRFAMATLTL